MPPNATVILKRGDQRHEVSVTGIFPYRDKKLYCAKIQPPASGLEYAHFSRFKVDRNAISFDDAYSVHLDPGTLYTLTVIDPVPVPLPDRFNGSVSETLPLFSAHIFRNINGQDVYFDSIDTEWSLAGSEILDLVARRRLTGSSVRVGQEPGHCVLLNDFFSNMSNLKQYMILFLEVDDQLVIHLGTQPYSTHSLPQEPKTLSYLAMRQLNRAINSRNTRQAAVLRRFIYALMNGAVIVDLIDELGLEVSGRRITSSCFERITLNWNESAKFPCAAAHFDLAKTGYAKLFEEPDPTMNEHTLAGLFWTVALNAVFLKEQPSRSTILTLEWNSKRVLQGFNECKVDYAVLLKCLPPGPDGIAHSFPLLLVEYGLETVTQQNLHKDFGKLTCMLSASCYELIKKLIELRRDPKIARVYGLLVGGTKAQLLIAHPVVIGNEHEIQVNISIAPEWEIDLVKRESVACQAQRRTRARQSVNPRESIVAPEEVIDWSSINLEAFQFTTATLNPPVEATGQSSSPREGNLEESSFAQLTFLGKLVIDSLNKICSPNQPEHDTSIYLIKKFHLQRTSPKKGKLDLSASLRSTVTKPLKQAELFINEHAGSCFPTFFPRIYDIQLPQDEDTVCYEMEELESLIRKDGWLHSRLSECDSAEETLFRFTKLLLDCLFQLHLLHKRLGFIHSDISPWNLMYSPIDGLWKLIDFGQSKTLADSAATERVAGTEDFVAPECLPHGRFSEASDVWSLGRVLEVILPPELSFSLPEKSLGVYDKLLSLYMNMKHDSPESRPTVIEAIDQALSIVLAFPSFVSVADPVIQGARTLTHSVFKTRFQKVEPAEFSEKDPIK